MTTITRPPNPNPAAADPTLGSSAPAIEIRGLSHSYGARPALVDLSLTIARGELFAVLGPNGGGKTTLFRLLSTLIPLQQGSAAILGHDLAREPHRIRSTIGVVFQAPSLDRKLTVAENIRIQAALYGIGGRELKIRSDELLSQFGLSDRAHELTERLSGGLRRRVELAKGLIHRPEVLLLDEPSAGLDPAARSDLWKYLKSLQAERGTTIVLTTHYLGEADGADRLAILNEGRLVALGAPDELRATVGGDSLTIESPEAAALADEIRQRLGLPAQLVDQAVRLEAARGHEWVPRLMEAFPGRITAVRLGRATLEDVFIARTGHRFWREGKEGDNDGPK